MYCINERYTQEVIINSLIKYVLSKSIEISLELEILILATIIIAINYRITS